VNAVSKALLEFFAMPDEQLRWLGELLAENGIWCVVRKLPPNWGIKHVTGAQFLTELQLTKPDETAGLQLFFGPSDFVPTPIWRIAENGDRDIDFIRSQAIQYCPSMVVREHVLLEGHMAIMRQGYYDEVGIAPKPVQEWFRHVAKSFVRLRTEGTVVLQDPKLGKQKEYPDIVATPGALEWQRCGHLLKQFVNGAYEFHVRVNN